MSDLTPGRLALVAVGGVVGALARWLVALAVPGLGGTLVANVTGAFALGALLAVAAEGYLPPRLVAFAATGALSSYTTYSTFAVESVLAGSPALVAGNVLANYGLGFAAAFAGRLFARRAVGGGE
ncbi:CrcB family protein [Halolamina sp.]|uniref:fluoride efflux transporter FluC n=1 Tax=Halolamina sp. TaxID=1940283 RepID=UPI00356A8167